MPALDTYFTAYREKSAVKKNSMEGLSYHKKNDNSTRNDNSDSEGTQKEVFSESIKSKTGKYKTPARNNSVNQKPKLVGLTKMVCFDLGYNCIHIGH